MIGGPIIYCPVEVLTLIFLAGQTEEATTIAPLTLSHVCRHWRAICLATPSLWSQIRLGDAYLNGLGRLKLHLQRSRSHPIDVCISLGWEAAPIEDKAILDSERGHSPGLVGRYHTRSDYEAVLNTTLMLLISQVSRWKSFHFCTKDKALMSMLLHTLSGTQQNNTIRYKPHQLRAPTLESLALVYDRHKPDDLQFSFPNPLFGGRTPRLKRVKLIRVMFSPFPPPFMRNLHFLSLDVLIPVRPALLIFHACPNLQFLRLPTTALEDMAQTEVALPAGCALSLALVDNRAWGLGCFSRHSLRTLTSLHISDSGSKTDRMDLRLLIALLPMITSLEQLDVDRLVSFPYSTKHRRIPLPALRSLTLRFVVCNEELDQILHWIDAPALKKLHIFCSRMLNTSMTPLLDFLGHSHPPLEELTYSYVNQLSDRIVSVVGLLPGLKFLRLYQLLDPGLLHVLAAPENTPCPLLTHLEVIHCAFNWREVERLVHARQKLGSPLDRAKGWLCDTRGQPVRSMVLPCSATR